MGYYGLFRVGELTEGPHTIKAPNVHIDDKNVRAILILYSLKTHSKKDRPQESENQRKPRYITYNILNQYRNLGFFHR